MKKTLFIALAALTVTGATAQKQPHANKTNYSIAMEGNTYTTKGELKNNRGGQGATTIDAENPTTVSLYFRNDSTGVVNFELVGSAVGSSSKVAIRLLGKTYKVKFNKTHKDSTLLASVKTSKPYIKVEFVDLKLFASVKTSKPGYIKVEFTPLAGQTELTALRVGGAVSDKTLSYVHNFSTYWGNRGPSVHLKYTLPKEPTRWFYNEVTVPEGQDVIGSYYMANGFGEGYFGMQCNSATERRILFSVWAPFETDDPKSIPDSLRIHKLRQGKDVHIGEFGNEGSGGQSYLKFPWKAGNTYKFLASVEPDGKGSTIYTGYFYAPEEGQWRVISSFQRPKTNVNYTGAHSFLENFSPTQGYITREVTFGNQWACGTDGVWRELTEGQFTYDATAAAGVRKDYAGGVKNDKFFLKNCGFFDQNTPYRAKFTRPAKGKAPVVDFEALKKL